MKGKSTVAQFQLSADTKSAVLSARHFATAPQQWLRGTQDVYEPWLGTTELHQP